MFGTKKRPESRGASKFSAVPPVSISSASAKQNDLVSNNAGYLPSLASVTACSSAADLAAQGFDRVSRLKCRFFRQLADDLRVV